ncbi:tyrosine-type recombinase/integrase [uncultured Desulfosarcina sp.]|uniref:tyrosine-type recombinase/integrase n=1 Tax=uncultured Desulfosarcina sp. TaxID=218289 RepID=UPI0029C84205|nr:tyrosine-type recombinase/integrase [uncultured Desulfosarcina sp.]
MAQKNTTIKNPNHPKIGDSIKVDPIKDIKDIKSIKRLLSDKPRDLCLFTLGINTNLRASDLLRITVRMVKDLKAGDELTLKEKKTGKHRRITLNKAATEAIQGLLKSREYKDEDPLFTGQRGPLTVPSVNRLVKQWCQSVNLKGNFGSHTMRKTFGYHQRVSFGVGLPELVDIFNHSSQRQTMTYLCIQPEEVKNVYMNEL